MKKLLLIGIAATLMLLGAEAQQVASPFGTTEEEILRCRQNLSLMQTTFSSGNFERALEHWREAYENCPASSINIYHFGPLIFRYFLDQETDPARRQEYIDKIMSIYDSRMVHFAHLEPRATALARKTFTYMEIMGNDADLNIVHSWLGEAINEMREEMNPAEAFWHYMTSSLMLFHADNSRREQYLADYFRITAYIDLAIANAEAAGDQENVVYLASLRDGIVAGFLSSGAADCESLTQIFAHQVEANRSNQEFLNEVLGIFSAVGCREADLFITVSELLYQIEPTANAAVGLAARAQRDGDIPTAIRFLTEAAELETDASRSSEHMMRIAGFYTAQRNFPRARQMANEALRFNPNNGHAHIFIAQLFAQAAPNIFPEGAAKSGLVFNLAVDRLERARSVDSSAAAEANRLIRNYTEHFMDAETGFMMGIRAGERVHIPGWINETTTIRFR
jgi:tetratricopeptide (TPR) repeat protein